LGRGVDFYFNNRHWRHILLLAHRYGWRPAGTELDLYLTKIEGMMEQDRHPDEDWDGTYFSNDLQWVTDEDAANIAQALERALEDIPDEDTVGELAASQSPDLEDAELIERYPGLEEYIVPPHLFGDEYRQYVREFIAFCRVSGFRIA
jgi:hypothetical protein